MPFVVTGHVAPRVELKAELFTEALAFGTGESEGEQHEFTRKIELGSVHGHEGGSTVDDLRAHLDGTQSRDVAVVVAEERHGVDGVHPFHPFFMG